MVTGALARRSFHVFEKDPRVAEWAEAALPLAVQLAADPTVRQKWLHHGGTWLVGVDVLPNAEDGSIGGVPLRGPWQEVPGMAMPLHQGQLSVVYPGYPKQDKDEVDSAYRFRVKRDAAHLDGLLAVGSEKRRFLKEPHAWVLGIPLNKAKASPLVVWEGSHEIIREAFLTALAGLPPVMWADVDLTAIYQDARAEVFEVCERTEVRLVPGQAVLMHRMAIHGVAPWAHGDSAPTEGRMIAYFRPQMNDMRDWLRLD